MGEVGRTIKEQVRAAAEKARTSADTHVAAAVNVGGEGHSTSVYSDGEVTVVTKDGRTEIIRHRDDDGDPGPAPIPRERGEHVSGDGPETA